MKKIICLILVCLMMASSVAFVFADNTYPKRYEIDNNEVLSYGIYYNIIWPTSSQRITSHFGMRDGKMHTGVDVGAVVPGVKGDKINAIAAGTVMAARSISTYGNVVYLNSEIEKTYVGIEPNSWSINDNIDASKDITPADWKVTLLRQSRYAHLDEISVQENQSIKRGTKVGTMGNTGESSAVHLHFEMRDIDDLDDASPGTSSAKDPLIYYPNTTFQSVGAFDKKGNFYGVEQIMLLTPSEITNLGISTEDIEELIADDYVKGMISEFGIIKLKEIRNYIRNN